MEMCYFLVYLLICETRFCDRHIFSLFLTKHLELAQFLLFCNGTFTILMLNFSIQPTDITLTLLKCCETLISIYLSIYLSINLSISIYVSVLPFLLKRWDQKKMKVGGDLKSFCHAEYLHGGLAMFLVKKKSFKDKIWPLFLNFKC